ncbi:hypothetical protein Tco_0257072 [Tanacetum coccineum]
MMWGRLPSVIGYQSAENQPGPKDRTGQEANEGREDRGHNTNDCYHLKKHVEESVPSDKLAHLVKDIRQGRQKNKGAAKGKGKVINMVRNPEYRERPYERVERYRLVDSPKVVEAVIEGFNVLRLYVDGGSSSEIMFYDLFNDQISNNQRGSNYHHKLRNAPGVPTDRGSSHVNPTRDQGEEALPRSDEEAHPQRKGKEPMQLTKDEKESP